MASVTVKAHPRARKTGFTGRLGEAYKMDIAAVPARGKANEEAERYLAALLRLPRSRVHVTQGAAGRMKVIEVEGMTQEALDETIARVVDRLLASRPSNSSAP